MEKIFKITKSQLVELLKAEAELNALKSGGVDNWEWCGESCQDFLNENGFNDFEELAECTLLVFEEIV